MEGGDGHPRQGRGTNAYLALLTSPAARSAVDVKIPRASKSRCTLENHSST